MEGEELRVQYIKLCLSIVCVMCSVLLYNGKVYKMCKVLLGGYRG